MEMSMENEKYITASPMNYDILKENARNNRKWSTEAESAMWSILRRKQLGVVFHRQYIIDDYIVDFVCLSKQLIIEVDGKYHFTAEQEEADKIREMRLKQMGFRLLRFTNEEVFLQPDNVKIKIQKALKNE